jgi:hypothetical protein
MRYPLLLLPVIFLVACDGQTRERRQARGDTYVSDPDHLYFKNIRSRDYQSVRLEEGVDAYYHDELSDPEALYIVDRWLDDEALLFRNQLVVPVDRVAALKEAYRDRADAAAAREVIVDYLRMTGN